MIFGRLLKLPNDMRKWDHVDKNFYRTKWKSAQFTTAPAVFKWCEKYFFASNAHTHKKQNWVSVAETVFFFNGTRRIWKKMCVSSLRKHYLKYLYTTILWLHFFSIFLCLFTGFVCIINTKQMRKMAKYFCVNLLHNFKCDIEITEKKNTEKIYINFYWTQKYDMNCFFFVPTHSNAEKSVSYWYHSAWLSNGCLQQFFFLPVFLRQVRLLIRMIWQNVPYF